MIVDHLNRWENYFTHPVWETYDEIEDTVCYEKSESARTGIVMHPGIFALFGPVDAHMPGLHASGNPWAVKKWS